ncbi:MAG: hypothetical protein LBV23_10935 [Deltaproteobacteria bacterium]|jgi:hypothetical protein|nr:hypothetical protein [Deltaproteobacteria bacterium]
MSQRLGRLKSFIVFFPRKYFLIALLVAFIVLMALMVNRFLISESFNSHNYSSAANLTPARVETQVGGKGTKEYNQMIELYDKQTAALARDRGDSFVATPVGQEEIVEKDKDSSPSIKKEKLNQALIVKDSPTPPIKPQPMAVKRLETNDKNEKLDFAPDNELYKLMLSDLKGLAGPSQNLGTPVIKIYKGEEQLLGEKNEARKIVDINKNQENSSLTDRSLNLKPATLLYASLLYSVNSEAPSPVLAEIISGPFKGSILMGSFVLLEERLSIAFNRLIDSRGQEIFLEALAIDPKTKGFLVPGKVNSRFLRRWGALMALNFIDGIGQALSRSATTVNVYGETLITQTQRPSNKDLALEALGKSGGAISSKLEKSFERAPTVTIEAGREIGALIISIGKIGNSP